MSWRGIWAFAGGAGLMVSVATGQVTGILGCLCVTVLAFLLPKAA